MAALPDGFGQWTFQTEAGPVRGRRLIYYRRGEISGREVGHLWSWHRYKIDVSFACYLSRLRAQRYAMRHFCSQPLLLEDGALVTVEGGDTILIREAPPKPNSRCHEVMLACKQCGFPSLCNERNLVLRIAVRCIQSTARLAARIITYS